MTSSRLFEYNQQYNAQNDDDTMPNAQNRGRLQWQRYAHLCMIFSESVLDIGDDDDHDDGIDDDDDDSIDDDDDDDIDDDDDEGIGKLRDSRSNPGSRDRWGDGGMATGKLIDINLGKHFFIEHVQ